MGHMLPMSQLAKALGEKGHRVYIITVGNETKPKIESIYENMQNVEVIFTQGMPQSTIRITMETNERNETGDEIFMNDW